MLPALKTGTAALALAKSVVEFIAGRLAADKDDELMRIEGVHFRDWSVPYNVNRKFVHKNKWLEVHDHVLPLPQSNGEAHETESLTLTAAFVVACYLQCIQEDPAIGALV